MLQITFAQEDNCAPDRPTGLSVLAGKDLTSREQQVWLLMAGGCSDAEVAERLALNCLTVRVHLSNALAKLGADSPHEAEALAARTGAFAGKGEPLDWLLASFSPLAAGQNCPPLSA
jgi:DNA-binding NarL/FixJ family response regulator